MKKSRLASNIGYNITYQVLVLIIPLITAPYISRTLNVDGLGTFSYVSSVAYYFFILISLGLNNYGNRTIAKCGEDRSLRSLKFWSIYGMQISLGVLVTFCYIIYTLIFADDSLKSYFAVYTIYVVSAAIDINWFFFGIQQFKLTTTRNAIVKILSLSLIFIFVKGKNALTYYMLIVAGSTLLSNIILWVQLRKYVSFYRPKVVEIITHIKPNLVLFIPILAMSIYRVMDKIMIKELSGVTQNGYYENADRIISISLTVFSAVATVMMPAISTMVAEGKSESIKRFLRDMMQITSCVSVAMTFGLIAISRQFAPLFFGEQYGETGILLIGLAPTIFLSGWKNVLRSQYLIPYEKDKAYVISLVSGAIVNVFMNAIFIPKLGARGAVIGTICAEFTGFMIQTYVVNKNFGVLVLARDAALFIPSGFIMGLFVYMIINYLPSSLFSIAITIVLGAIIYFALTLLIMRAIVPKRLYYYRQLLHNRIRG